MKTSARAVARFLNKATGIARGPDRQIVSGHFNDHHKWYPRKQYLDDSLANLFRNLPCQRVVVELTTHSDYHRSRRYPKPPTRRQMRKQILKCYENGCKGGGCIMPIQVIGPMPSVELPNYIIFVDPIHINPRLPKSR